MAILNKTRKLLWARSGNRCAICRCELTMKSTNNKNDFIVGDECHIVSRNINGPRGNSSKEDKYLNSYDNLILLCKIHHKLVDDQPSTYTVEYLCKVKEGHEKWVRSLLQTDDLNKDLDNVRIELVIEYIKNKRNNYLYRNEAEKAISMLEPRFQFVLQYLYGLFGVRKHSCREVANMLGVSTERIRRLEKQAFRKLNEI